MWHLSPRFWSGSSEEQTAYSRAGGDAGQVGEVRSDVGWEAGKESEVPRVAGVRTRQAYIKGEEVGSLEKSRSRRPDPAPSMGPHGELGIKDLDSKEMRREEEAGKARV